MLLRRKWPTVFWAGAVIGVLGGVLAATASAAPVEAQAERPWGAVPVEQVNTGPTLMAKAHENWWLQVLTRLRLTDSQLDKGIKLVQETKERRRELTAKLDSLLTEERQAILEGDDAQIRRIQAELRETQRALARQVGEWRASFWALLAAEQRRSLARLLPQSLKPGQRISSRTNLRRRHQSPATMAPWERWSQGLAPNGWQSVLPRWHPERDLQQAPATRWQSAPFRGRQQLGAGLDSFGQALQALQDARSNRAKE
jgi:hypothetical protein